MGSVKDLQVIVEATRDGMGRGRFTFTDRYSVFDWGEMPDQIPHKGAAIAVLASYFFEKLESLGIPTHYVGVVENDQAMKIEQATKPADAIEMKLVRVVKPALTGDTYDYSAYKNEKGGILVPLEVIYRNSLPEGSSVFKRLKEGQTTPEELGLSGMPEPNQKLESPILDVSTKLEITDRYMSWGEAQKIAGLSADEVSKLKELTLTINKLITGEFATIGLVNEDGKIEVGFDLDRNFMLVDVLGTLDECRFTYDGLPVSKEIARIYYRNTLWYNDIEDAKKKDRQHWKRICASKPEPLPAELKKRISQVYCACTNQITGRTWFDDTPPLRDIMQGIKTELRL